MSPSCAVDTVILLYFLLAGEAELLIDTLGSPLGIPRIIYDPDEGDIPNGACSEITQSIAYHRQAAVDHARDAVGRDLAARNVKQLLTLKELSRAGNLEVMDLATAETEMFGKLTGQRECGAYGLRFPLGYGEAACVVIAVARSLPLATDNRDALRALHHISPGHQYQRIRKLLIQAAERGRITKTEANAVHQRMTALGFWDRQLPFPG